MIDCLEYALGRSDISILWHSNCCAQFRSKEESERRLQRKFFEHANECKECNHWAPASSYVTRSQAEPVHWNKYIFCQRENPKGRLSAVVSAKFRSSPVLSQPVRLRVADECDLISAGAKYHLACLHSFQNTVPSKKWNWSGCAMSWSMQRRNVKLLTREVDLEGYLSEVWSIVFRRRGRAKWSKS